MEATMEEQRLEKDGGWVKWKKEKKGWEIFRCFWVVCNSLVNTICDSPRVGKDEFREILIKLLSTKTKICKWSKKKSAVQYNLLFTMGGGG